VECSNSIFNVDVFQILVVCILLVIPPSLLVEHIRVNLHMGTFLFLLEWTVIQNIVHVSLDLRVPRGGLHYFTIIQVILLQLCVLKVLQLVEGRGDSIHSSVEVGGTSEAVSVVFLESGHGHVGLLLEGTRGRV